MIKLKYFAENFDLARLALSHWKHDESTLPQRLQRFRISSNAVYPFDRDGQLCFLRMAPMEEKDGQEWLGEMDFLAYLQKNGYPAMRPLPAENGDLLVLLDTSYGKWYACAFEGVAGQPLEDVTMTEELAETYGAALGKLHQLSLLYVSPIRRRNEQTLLAWIEKTLHRHAAPRHMLACREEIARQLAALSPSPNNYGLIHYDFEPDNVFWNGETCSVIDFEDGMLHFYAADVVQALDELPEAFHPAFLRGYRQTSPDVHMEERDFPLMRAFRDLYSYARLLHCLSEKPSPLPEWMPRLIDRLEARLHALEQSFLK